jgi:hypothetical protein
MEHVVVSMDNGDVLEFSGTLVARSSREIARDGRRSTVFEYRLYRTEAGGYVLALDSFEKIRARSFFLRFNSRDDARDYVARDDGAAALTRDLFGPGEDGGGERG